MLARQNVIQDGAWINCTAKEISQGAISAYGVDRLREGIFFLVFPHKSDMHW